MAIDKKDIQILASNVVNFFMKHCFNFVKQRPIASFTLLFYVTLYIFVPSTFWFLNYSLPFVVFIAVSFRIYTSVRKAKDVNKVENGNDAKSSRENQVEDDGSKRYNSAHARSVRRRRAMEFMESSPKERKSSLSTGVGNDLIEKRALVGEMGKENREVGAESIINRPEFSSSSVSKCLRTLFQDDSLIGSQRYTGNAVEMESSENTEDEDEDRRGDERKAIQWNEDDQRNLMDLGVSEMERNKRLESLIARRRARKLMSIQVRRTLMNMGGSEPLSLMTSIMIPKQSHFAGSGQFSPAPGSAPSVLLPMRNPFDLPYEPHEEKPNLTGDDFHQEFMVDHPKETVFCRHESFSLGALLPRELKQDIHEASSSYHGHEIKQVNSEKFESSKLGGQLDQENDEKIIKHGESQEAKSELKIENMGDRVTVEASQQGPELKIENKSHPVAVQISEKGLELTLENKGDHVIVQASEKGPELKIENMADHVTVQASERGPEFKIKNLGDHVTIQASEKEPELKIENMGDHITVQASEKGPELKIENKGDHVTIKASEKGPELKIENMGNHVTVQASKQEHDLVDIHREELKNEVQKKSVIVENSNGSLSSPSPSSSDEDAPNRKIDKDAILKSLSSPAPRNIATDREGSGRIDGILHEDGPSMPENTRKEGHIDYGDKNMHHTPSNSIASDLQVEVSEVGSPALTNDGNISSPDDEVSSCNGNIETGDEDMWVASQNLSGVDENESRSKEIREVSEEDIIGLGFSTIGDKSGNSTASNEEIEAHKTYLNFVNDEEFHTPRHDFSHALTPRVLAFPFNEKVQQSTSTSPNHSSCSNDSENIEVPSKPSNMSTEQSSITLSHTGGNVNNENRKIVQEKGDDNRELEIHENIKDVLYPGKTSDSSPAEDTSGQPRKPSDNITAVEIKSSVDDHGNLRSSEKSQLVEKNEIKDTQVSQSDVIASPLLHAIRVGPVSTVSTSSVLPDPVLHDNDARIDQSRPSNAEKLVHSDIQHSNEFSVAPNESLKPSDGIAPALVHESQVAPVSTVSTSAVLPDPILKENDARIDQSHPSNAEKLKDSNVQQSNEFSVAPKESLKPTDGIASPLLQESQVAPVSTVSTSSVLPDPVSHKNDERIDQSHPSNAEKSIPSAVQQSNEFSAAPNESLKPSDGIASPLVHELRDAPVSTVSTSSILTDSISQENDVKIDQSHPSNAEKSIPSAVQQSNEISVAPNESLKPSDGIASPLVHALRDAPVSTVSTSSILTEPMSQENDVRIDQSHPSNAEKSIHSAVQQSNEISVAPNESLKPGDGIASPLVHELRDAPVSTVSTSAVLTDPTLKENDARIDQSHPTNAEKSINSNVQQSGVISVAPNESLKPTDGVASPLLHEIQVAPGSTVSTSAVVPDPILMKNDARTDQSHPTNAEKSINSNVHQSNEISATPNESLKPTDGVVSPHEIQVAPISTVATSAVLPDPIMKKNDAKIDQLHPTNAEKSINSNVQQSDEISVAPNESLKPTDGIASPLLHEIQVAPVSKVATSAVVPDPLLKENDVKIDQSHPKNSEKSINSTVQQSNVISVAPNESLTPTDGIVSPHKIQVAPVSTVGTSAVLPDPILKENDARTDQSHPENAEKSTNSTVQQSIEISVAPNESLKPTDGIASPLLHEIQVAPVSKVSTSAVVPDPILKENDARIDQSHPTNAEKSISSTVQQSSVISVAPNESLKPTDGIVSPHEIQVAPVSTVATSAVLPDPILKKTDARIDQSHPTNAEKSINSDVQQSNAIGVAPNESLEPADGIASPLLQELRVAPVSTFSTSAACPPILKENDARNDQSHPTNTERPINSDVQQSNEISVVPNESLKPTNGISSPLVDESRVAPVSTASTSALHPDPILKENDARIDQSHPSNDEKLMHSNVQQSNEFSMDPNESLKPRDSHHAPELTSDSRLQSSSGQNAQIVEPSNSEKSKKPLEIVNNDSHVLETKDQEKGTGSKEVENHHLTKQGLDETEKPETSSLKSFESRGIQIEGSTEPTIIPHHDRLVGESSNATVSEESTSISRNMPQQEETTIITPDNQGNNVTESTNDTRNEPHSAVAGTASVRHNTNDHREVELMPEPVDQQVPTALTSTVSPKSVLHTSFSISSFSVESDRYNVENNTLDERGSSSSNSPPVQSVSLLAEDRNVATIQDSSTSSMVPTEEANSIEGENELVVHDEEIQTTKPDTSERLRSQEIVAEPVKPKVDADSIFGKNFDKPETSTANSRTSERRKSFDMQLFDADSIFGKFDKPETSTSKHRVADRRKSFDMSLFSDQASMIDSVYSFWGKVISGPEDIQKARDDRKRRLKPPTDDKSPAKK